MNHEAAAMLEVQGVVKNLSRRFAAALSLDPDELTGEGQIIALKAVREFDPEKGAKLTTWVYECIWKFFCMKVRSTTWKRRVCLKEGEELWFDRVGKEEFRLENFLTDLSEEAAWVVKLALGHGHKKTSLKRILRREFGWELREILRVFTEVRDAL